MRLATWENAAYTAKFGDKSSDSKGNTSASIWLCFRAPDEDRTTLADTIRDFGLYIWMGKDRKISFTTKFHNVYSADMSQLQAMVKFLRKHQIDSPFYTLEGRAHLTLLVETILTSLKVTEQVSYPSGKVTRVDIHELVSTIINHANNLGWFWDF